MSRFGFHIRAKGAVKKREGMNRLEASYSQHLQARQNVGDILWFSEHEALKVRLAQNTHYIIDFLVLTGDGVLEIHDTKGTTKRKVTKGGVEIGKTETYWCPAKNKQKLKLVAELYPIVVKVLWRNKAGQWIEEEI